MKKGKLIVISGTDGTGKTTQAELLTARLYKEGYHVETTDFPQYGQPSCFFAEKYLNGEYGTVEEVGPYKASIFFALDRFEAGPGMHKALEDGKVIVSNRYVSANQAHQGGKIENTEERQIYLDWLDHLEYDIFDIPRPNLDILLYLPPEVGQEMVSHKTKGRDYIKNATGKDIHEANIEHLQKSAKTYLEMAKKYPNWKIIDCMDGDKIMTREQIAERIWEVVEPIVKDAKK